MPKIKVIPLEEATGRLKEIYDDLVKKRGKLAEVHKIQSLRPESIVRHMDLYIEVMFSKSQLSRAEREMMAIVTSAANKCSYCQVHHAEALNHYWKDDQKVKLLCLDYHSAGLQNRENVLCDFSELLTKSPLAAQKPEVMQSLRSIGLSDEAILDATLVVSYFNFVNRLVLALGVEISDEEMSGYNY